LRGGCCSRNRLQWCLVIGLCRCRRERCRVILRLRLHWRGLRRIGRMELVRLDRHHLRLKHGISRCGSMVTHRRGVAGMNQRIGIRHRSVMRGREMARLGLVNRMVGGLVRVKCLGRVDWLRGGCQAGVGLKLEMRLRLIGRLSLRGVRLPHRWNGMRLRRGSNNRCRCCDVGMGA